MKLAWILKFDLFKSIFCVLAVIVAPIYASHVYTYNISDFESLSLSLRGYKIISGINTLAPKTDALKAAVTSIATANKDKTTDKNRDESTTKAVLKVDRAEDDTVPWPRLYGATKNDPYPTKGTPVEGHNLCKAYSTGTNRTDCVYKHPEVVNYVIFTESPRNICPYTLYTSFISQRRSSFIATTKL